MDPDTIRSWFFYMAELACKEEKRITTILPRAQKVASMNYFSSPDTMW